MNVPAKLDDTANQIAEAVFLKGDFSVFSPHDKAKYLIEVCRSLGLNPLTRPIEFIKLNGRDVPYAKRDCADQLRKLNGISIAIVSKEERDGLLFVHVRATDKHGREDEDFGAVPMNDAIKGEARANAFLKAVTKAKRRVTLSISGLGFLDETEVDDARSATIRRPSIGANPMLPPHNPETGEISDYAEQVENVIGNGNGNATQEAKEDTETKEVHTEDRSAEAQDSTITDKVAICGSMKALKNYFNTLSSDEQAEFRDAFAARRAELEAS